MAVKTMKVVQPWTSEQVAALNKWQQLGIVHSFTCPNDGSDLLAEEDGWHCDFCEYTQDWAHDFMFNPFSLS